ncbi:MAG: hypothetical protein AB7L09_00640 [Nitrospira sp.]
MKIHNANATPFDSKSECQRWIDARIVRFKLRVQHGLNKDGHLVVASLQKAEGRIIDSAIDGFHSQAYDEPLGDYAEPVQEGEKWLAVMKVSS